MRGLIEDFAATDRTKPSDGSNPVDVFAAQCGIVFHKYLAPF
jgi:hypothetical protein